MSKLDNAFMWAFTAAAMVGLAMSALVLMATLDVIGV